MTITEFPALEETLKNTKWGATWEAKWKAIGKEQKAIDVAKKMVSSGFPIEMVVSMTELDPEKVKTLYQGTDTLQ